MVSLPLEAADFREALDSIALHFGGGAGRAKTIAVAGATGGCGATSVALNLAYELAFQRQIQVVLVELSLRMGVLASYLDVRPRFSASDLLVRLDQIDSYAVRQALTQIADNFFILPGPFDAIEPALIKPEGSGGCGGGWMGGWP